MPAHTQFLEKRNKKLYDDAAQRWNTRRKQLDKRKLNMTASLGF